MTSTRARIGDHALIGDGRSAALVRRDGCVVWLGWPRFDSDPVLWSILDEQGGEWSLSASGPHLSSTQRYVPDTNVLVTEHAVPSGRVRVVDLMPVASERDKRSMLVAEHELLRRIECVEGSCEMTSALSLRPAFGALRTHIHRPTADTLAIDTRRGAFALRSSAASASVTDGAIVHRFALRAGEQAELSLSYAEDGPLVLVPLGGARSEEVIARSIAWWQSWSSRARYRGEHRPAVLRSLLVLKALMFAPSGAIVAAPTTSLPEREGGDLNWDYRFCWIRDAAFTVSALFDLGYHEEAEAFVSWLLHSTRLTRPEIRVLYDVYGRTPRAERELRHLRGFGGARPVRTGNAAVDQLQLDVYGEVVDAVARLVQREDVRLDRETQSMLVELGRFVCDHWREPDQGIWEPRSAPRAHTHSRVLCWVALERLIELAERGVLRRAPIDRLARERDAIRVDVEARGFHAGLGGYVQTLDGDVADASLLQLGLYGWRPPSDPRMRGTYALVQRRLQVGEGLVRRNEQSRASGEGAFGVCSYWVAEHLARGGGTLAEARAWFEHVCRHANHVGLFAEEIDPADGSALGNFPQAFTHVGLLGAALAIETRAARDSRAYTAEARP